MPSASDGEIAQVVANPLLHAEAKAVAPFLAAAAAPCGADWVRLCLGGLVLVFGVSEAAKVPAYWAAYIEDLSEFPAEALAMAIRDYRRSKAAEYFPKSGPLRHLAEQRAIPIRLVAFRAALIAKAVPPPVYAAADLESRRALVAELLNSLKIKKV